MTTVTVSSASELQAALSSAQGGDTINLAAGNYGDVYIGGKNFASDVTITSLNSGSPASFHSLTVNGSSHIKLDTIAVNLTPTATSIYRDPAVSFVNSDYISLIHSTVKGGNAINGVSQTSTTEDATGNVIGLPTGYGIAITHTNHVVVDGNDVATFNKGVVLYASDYITLSHNDVHDMRTSGIVGGGGNHVTVDSNHIHDSNPWNWGAGDHGDYIAFWTNANQTSASTDFKVINNVMEQGSGRAILGMWFQGDSAKYTDVVISGNTILNGNFQGIILWDVNGASIDHNTLLQSSGTDWKSGPGILINGGAVNVTTHDNITGSYQDHSNAAAAVANTAANNYLVQKWDPSAAGYYSSSLITLIDTLTNYSSIYSIASTKLPGLGSNPLVGETIVGGLGADLLVSTGVTGGSTISGGAGSDTIYGGPSTSVLRGEDGNDVIYAQHGFNDINGNAGADTIFGGDGNDWLVGGRDNDEIHGGSGTQILHGNLGDDTLIGGTGSETIRGGQGSDVMTGGAGNDWLSGDLGDDTISGGAGADIFHTFAGVGIDRVLDFNSAQGDRVMLDPGTSYTLRFDGANMIVDMGGSDQLVLVGVTPTTIGTWLAA